ncbi:hypothetical protein REPUB_Repub03eG0135200 [Reevesia pubescens]
MASLQKYSNLESQIPAEIIVARVIQTHDSISMLESLRPSNQVNSLFSHLVKLCTLPSDIDIHVLPQKVQDMRNYVKLASLEYGILSENGVVQPKKVAFVGSGPLPLTSIVMATHHMKSTHFDNFDIDEAVNDVARHIAATDCEFEKRMKFVTGDVIELREKLEDYDCIFLAALVGMSKEEKSNIVGHIRKYMKEGGFLLVRSANGARAFLYPVVEEHDLPGFEVLSVFHPTDEVVNSVVLVRKPTF